MLEAELTTCILGSVVVGWLAGLWILFKAKRR